MIVAALAAFAVLQAPQGTPFQPERGAIQPPPVAAAAMAADTGMLRHRSGRTPPVALGVRIEGPAPRIDGRLDDAAWAAARPITELYQNEPREGQPASERTEVRILYDDGAVYVGARMFDSEPQLIRTQLTRRDNISNSDLLTVAFDSYHDHRTSFRFEVNPSGVRADMITEADNQFGDSSWDPVWEAETQRDSLGWSAEMRIPLSQLRFPPADEQTWGINVRRYIQRKAETAEFAWKAQTDQGFTSYFGHLFGLSRLPQPRRLELLPYVSGSQTYSAGDPGNPFQDGSQGYAAAGLDLKYGLTSNLTVDATFNPDFGQVEQDPAFVNLSAFEQFLSERRPFFVAGSNVFSYGGPQFFYSRRIGQPPHGSPDDHQGYSDSPDNSTILGAAKISGRTASGWSIGLLEALTAREYGIIDSSGTRFEEEVEPLTNFAVARVKKDLRGGSSTVGGIFTAVNRDLSHQDLRFLRRAAYGGGLDFSHRFAGNKYSVSGSVSGSYIRGAENSIQNAQLSSARYYQRPDAGHVEYDSTRTALTGWSSRLSFQRIQGSFQYGTGLNATSPGFEINDAGFMSRADQYSGFVYGNRRWTRPGKVFRSASLGGEIGSSFNFGGVRLNSYAGFFGNAQLLNYWSFNGNLFTNIRAYSDNLTRGGPLGVSPTNINGFLGINTDSRKRWEVFLGSFFFTNEIGSNEQGVFSTITVRPSPSVQLSVGPSVSRSRTIMQFLGSQADTLNAAMYGGQYVFAQIDQRSLDMTTRLNVTFSPRLSLELFAQPFIATGSYSDYKELTAPRTTDFIHYGTTPGSTIMEHRDPTTSALDSVVVDPDGSGARPQFNAGNPNFTVRSLRGNAVLRWEYRPGSTLFLVWTQNCGLFSSDPQFSPGSDVGRLCQGKSTNAFAVKLNTWLSL